MRQLTVYSIEETLHKRLQQEAEKQGISINKYILNILRASQHIREQEKDLSALHHDLDHLAGTWDENDQREFEIELRKQRDIDGEMW
jgi:hypothetical protein